MNELTDEYIMEHACEKAGCTNWAENGYTLCPACMHGEPWPMNARAAQRKLSIEAALGLISK